MTDHHATMRALFASRMESAVLPESPRADDRALYCAFQSLVETIPAPQPLPTTTAAAAARAEYSENQEILKWLHEQCVTRGTASSLDGDASDEDGDEAAADDGDDSAKPATSIERLRRAWAFPNIPFPNAIRDYDEPFHPTASLAPGSPEPAPSPRAWNTATATSSSAGAAAASYTRAGKPAANGKPNGTAKPAKPKVSRKKASNSPTPLPAGSPPTATPAKPRQVSRPPSAARKSPALPPSTAASTTARVCVICGREPHYVLASEVSIDPATNRVRIAPHDSQLDNRALVGPIWMPLPAKRRSAAKAAAADADSDFVDELDGGPAYEAVYMHMGCALWAPQIVTWLREDQSIGWFSDVEIEIKRTKSAKCSACGLKGGLTGCQDRACRHTYHVPCARDGVLTSKAKPKPAAGPTASPAPAAASSSSAAAAAAGTGDPVPRRAQFVVAGGNKLQYRMHCPLHYDTKEPIPDAVPHPPCVLPAGTVAAAAPSQVEADTKIAETVVIEMADGSEAGPEPPESKRHSIAALASSSTLATAKRKAAPATPAPAAPNHASATDDASHKRVRHTPMPAATVSAVVPSSGGAVAVAAAPAKTADEFFAAIDRIRGGP